MERANLGSGAVFSTEATPLIIDLKASLVNLWYIALQEITRMEYYKSKGADAWKEESKRAIFNLFIAIRVALKNDLKADFPAIEEAIRGKNADKMIAAFYIIDEYLYNKGLTKFDNKQAYNRQIAEQANTHKGF